MSRKICLGKIIAAHGVKGEVKIKSYTEKEEDIFKFTELKDVKNNIFKLKKTGKANGAIIAKIEHIKNRDEALLLKGKDLFVDRNQLPEIKDDEFYYEDLVNLEVRDINNESIGKIKSVQQIGSNDVLEIEFNENHKNNFFPFNKTFFPEIKIKDGYIIFVEKDFE